jgi:hypothetical protein
MISRTFFIVAIALIVVVIRINNLGTVFRSINTLVHELGHAFMGLLCGGKVSEIKLNENASGSCTSATKGKLKPFLVSIAGYLCSALMGWLLFYTCDKVYRGYVFYYFAIVGVIALIFWIRNTYGIIWTICFVCLNVGIILYPKAFNQYSAYIIVVYALLITIDNIIACCTLFYLSITEHKKAGDATILAKITHLPAFIWAIAFCAAAFWSGYQSWLLMWH